MTKEENNLPYKENCLLHAPRHTQLHTSTYAQKHINLILHANTFMVRGHLKCRIFPMFLLFLLFFCLSPCQKILNQVKLFLVYDVLDEQNNSTKLCEASFCHLEPLHRSAGKYLPTQLKHLISHKIYRRVKSDFPVFNLETSSNSNKYTFN